AEGPALRAPVPPLRAAAQPRPGGGTATRDPRTAPARALRPGSGRGTIVVAMVALGLALWAIVARLVEFGMETPAGSSYVMTAQQALAAPRPNIVDRNGAVLAMDIRTASLYVDPSQIIDVDEAYDAIAAVFPQLAGTTLW